MHEYVTTYYGVLHFLQYEVVLPDGWLLGSASVRQVHWHRAATKEGPPNIGNVYRLYFIIISVELHLI